MSLLEDVMSFALYNLVVKLLLVTSLLVPGAQNLLQGQNLAEVQASYAETLEQRGDLMAQLDEREADYGTLLEQVDLLKSGPNTLQNRMELEGLLRDSRLLAKQMQALQQKIRSADRRLGNQRGQLVAAIDARMNDIESQLAETSSANRRELVSTLNGLRAQRRKFTQPLPSAPTDGEVNETLAMIEELEEASAADLLAAADEIQDTEDQVRKRLDAIEGRIDQLRRARTLARRARNFAAEERFFDETDRSRFIAGFDRAATDSGNASNGGAPSEDVTAGGNNGSPTAGDPATDDSARDEGEAESPGSDFAGAPNSDADLGSGATDDSLSDQPETPSSAPDRQQDSGGEQDGDVFGGGDDMLVDSQSNPQRTAGTGFESDHDLDTRIQRLESEQKRLKQQASELEKEAEQLRKRATDSLD
jgi:hypothetical protein